MSRLAWVPLLSLLSACGGASMTSGPSGPPSPAPSPAAMPTPVATPTPAPAATPTPEPQAVVLRRATFRGANGHSASGSALIERAGTRHSLELGSDFRLDSGNTDVYLTRDPGGITDRDLNLGSLGSLRGAQSFAMPNDGSQYGYVVLWCKPFRVVIGVGELR